MKAKEILSRFKSKQDSIYQLEKELESQRDRANNFRDILVKLDRRLGYLECAKHSYKFTCLRKVGEVILGGMVVVKRSQGYVFTCVHCLHEVVKREKDLTPTQRTALRTLKIGEVKNVSEKR